MWEMACTDQEKALARLAIGAFFHAMRSCEYLRVAGERRTKIVCKQDVRFFLGSRELPHDHPDLFTADAVQITFRFQKSLIRDACITMYRTRDKILCPVRAWAGVILSLIHI